MGLLESLLAIEHRKKFKNGFKRAIDICVSGGDTKELKAERIRHVERFGTDKELPEIWEMISGALTDHFNSVLPTWTKKAVKKGCDPEHFKDVAQFCFENGMFEQYEKELATAKKLGLGPFKK